MRSSGRVEESSLKLMVDLRLISLRDLKLLAVRRPHILDLQLICKLN